MVKRCIRRRRSHKARKARRALKTRRNRNTQRGGGTLPIPRGSVASMSLDAKDEYAVPVLIRREVAEEELLDE